MKTPDPLSILAQKNPNITTLRKTLDLVPLPNSQPPPKHLIVASQISLIISQVNNTVKLHQPANRYLTPPGELAGETEF